MERIIDKIKFPSDWKKTKISSIGTVFKGKGISKSEVAESGFPCIRYGEIYTDYNFKFNVTKSFINKVSASLSQPIKYGDILFAGSGETAEEIGKAVTYIGSNDAFAGGDIVILRPSEPKSGLFLGYYLNSNFINQQKAQSGQGHSVVHLYGKNVEEIDIVLPPLPEQQKIASILSKWDETIEAQTQIIEAKEKHKKGLMQKLLTGEVRFPGFEGEDIIEGVLSDFVGLKHGYQFRKEDFVQDGVPVIKIGNVIGQNLSFEGVTYISESRLEKFRDFQIYDGDLLMSLTGNIGRVIEVQNLGMPVVQNYRVGKFYSLSEDVLSKDFLKYLLSSPTLLNQLLSYANQSAQANFGKQDMDKLSVTFPANISEQKKIGGLLNKCDLELQSLKDELDALKLQKKGLMQELLTGKIRVKN